MLWVETVPRNTPGEENCRVDNNGYPLGPPTIYLLITGEESQTCKSLLAARANDVTDGVVWDCFAEE